LINAELRFKIHGYFFPENIFLTETRTIFASPIYFKKNKTIPMQKNIIITILTVFGLFSCKSTQKLPENTKNNAPMIKVQNEPTQPDWAASANLYEINVRQFSPEGTLAGVEKQLPRLHAMGVDVVWLMPIYPISVKNRKGSLGSPYAVQDYKKVNPEFGSMVDLQRLVKKTHALGMKIILDWVPNHTGWDNVWMTEKPNVFAKFNGELTVPLNEKGEQITDWADVCELDYAKPETRAAMIDALAFWVKKADIDGFRCDMAGLVADDFWPEARTALDKIKPLFMLSEWQDAPSHFTSFNANYGWKWKDVTKNIAAEKVPASALDGLLTELQAFYPKHFFQVYFTQNHDENTWTGYDKMLYGDATNAFLALACTWQGMPLIYNGQEDDLSQQLQFFEKDPILWKNCAKSTFLKAFFELKHKNRALDAGLAGGVLQKIKSSDDSKIYAFSREKNGQRVVCMFNFSSSKMETKLDFKGLEGNYSELFSSKKTALSTSFSTNLEPWGFRIFYF
jgi:alpha-amylase